MTEPTDRDVAHILEGIGPFEFHVWRSENYSGEHRKWKEEFTEPQGGDLTREIIRAAYPIIERDTIARLAAQSGVDALEIVLRMDEVWVGMFKKHIIYSQAEYEAAAVEVIREALAAAVAGERARVAEARYDQHIADGGY